MENLAMTDRLAAVVLAAGKGTRMKSDRPKVLHPVAGRPMIEWVLDAAGSIGADPIVVVTAPDQEALRRAVDGRATAVVQEQALGTGDAVKPAREALAGIAATGGTVLVLYGDTPMMSAATLSRMVRPATAWRTRRSSCSASSRRTRASTDGWCWAPTTGSTGS